MKLAYQLAGILFQIVTPPARAGCGLKLSAYPLQNLNTSCHPARAGGVRIETIQKVIDLQKH